MVTQGSRRHGIGKWSEELSESPTQAKPADEDAPGFEHPAIEAVGLTRHFGQHCALDDVTLVIPARETFGLLGANGAGKTTFIRLVMGLLLPSAGRVRVDGVDAAAHPTEVQRRVGFVMETSCLYPELSVGGFLRFVGSARGLAGDALERAIASGLQRFHLGAVVKRPIGNLSKGYQQRVSLAQAFLHDPPLIVVDEPTGGLDPVQRESVQRMLKSLEGERTVLLCTHDLEEARRLTSRVAVLRAGRLVTVGPTADVLGRDDTLELFGGESLAL